MVNGDYNSSEGGGVAVHWADSPCVPRALSHPGESYDWVLGEEGGRLPLRRKGRRRRGGGGGSRLWRDCFRFDSQGTRAEILFHLLSAGALPLLQFHFLPDREGW